MVSQRERWHIFQRDNFTCQYCGQNIITNRGLILEIDHIKPRSKGGTDSIDNLTTACYDCNHGKHADFVKLPITIKKENPIEIEKLIKKERNEIDYSSWTFEQLYEECKRRGFFDNRIETKNFKDFTKKTGLSPSQAIGVLEKELVFKKKYPNVKRIMDETGATIEEIYNLLEARGIL